MKRSGVGGSGTGATQPRNARGQGAARSAGDWWASYFDADYLTEYGPIFDLQRDRREVARLVELLALPAGARVLDLPCGQGRHAHLLAEAGFDVDGVDYSPDLLAAARQRGTGRTLRYTRADMRQLPARWSGRFDAVVNLFTSFGFFADPADDARTIAEVARVLAPGGMFIFHAGSRDGVMAKFLTRDWWRTSDGTTITQERSFDPLSGQLTIETSSAGPSAFVAREHRIRLYTATRIAELCAANGLTVTEAHDGWRDRPLTRRSGEMLLVAHKAPPVSPMRRPRPAARTARLPGAGRSR
ncbi:MAG: methyltransferase domain-containing protein [Gemmatimonadaceae bacterium]|nr:methyltransferase domain-containing protein [Gemmatimonadaceae bacterium]